MSRRQTPTEDRAFSSTKIVKTFCSAIDAKLSTNYFEWVHRILRKSRGCIFITKFLSLSRGYIRCPPPHSPPCVHLPMSECQKFRAKKAHVTSSLDTKLIPLCAGAKAGVNRWQYHIQPKSI